MEKNWKIFFIIFKMETSSIIKVSSREECTVRKNLLHMDINMDMIALLVTEVLINHHIANIEKITEGKEQINTFIESPETEELSKLMYETKRRDRPILSDLERSTRFELEKMELNRDIKGLLVVKMLGNQHANNVRAKQLRYGCRMDDEESSNDDESNDS